MRKCIFVLIFLLMHVGTQAQQNTLSLNFQMSLPMGNYKDTYPKTGTGLLLGYLHPLALQTAVAIGVDAGLLQINSKSERYTGFYGNDYHPYIISTSNYILTLAPKLRIELLTVLKTGKIFIDGSIGTNVFFSYTAISHNYDYNFIRNEVLGSGFTSATDSSRSHAYWALKAGIGPGIALPLGKKGSKHLLLQCSYVYGSKAAYFTHPYINQLQIHLEPKKSNTSMLLAELGFLFNISGKKTKG